MRNSVVAIAMFLMATFANAEVVPCSYAYVDEEHLLTLSVSDDSWDLVEVYTDNQLFISVDYNSSILTEKKGWAQLPVVNVTAQLYDNANYELVVKNVEYKDVKLNHPILPSRGVIFRNENPDDIPYLIDSNSLVDAFYPAEVATLSEAFIIRDVRGATTSFSPFQYNPITKTLRVYSEIEVALVKNDEKAVNVLDKTTAPVAEMVSVYKDVFVNFKSDVYPLPYSQNGELLVITTQRDENTIERYIDWKRAIGFKVYKEVVEQGTNVKDIIKERYEENPNILYVQLVGDWADIKSDNSIDDSPTDPKMGCVAGDDNFPDLIIGRFSCSSKEELDIQIDKTINYEKNPNVEPSWRTSFCGIASHEGPGDDNEIDSVHVIRIYDQRLNPQLNYDTFHRNFANRAQISDIKQQIEDGVSAIAYCGHGSSTSWSTSGFSNTSINGLNNGDKLPFIVSVACLNGAYHNASDCFAEAWLKKENGGAVVALMSTISQAWVPPMRGQDYFFDIISGGFDYDEYNGQQGFNTSEQRFNWGAVVLNAFSLMLTESQGNYDVETVHTWCTFGDVTLQLFTDVPQNMAISNVELFDKQLYTTVVEDEEGNPLVGAKVSISQNSKNYCAVTDSLGSVSIEHDFDPGKAVITATSFNMMPVFVEAACYSDSGVYLTIDDYHYSDSMLIYGTSSSVSLNVKNFGIDTAYNVSLSISADCEYITFTDSVEIVSTVDAYSTSLVENCFSFDIERDAPDGYVASAIVEIACGESVWQEEITMQLHNVLPCFISSGVEGELLPNETVEVVAMFGNVGSLPIEHVFARVDIDRELVDVLSPAVSVGDIYPHDTVSVSFEVVVNENVEFGTVIPVTVSLMGDNAFSYDVNFELIVEQCNEAVTQYPFKEDFEQGVFGECWQEEYISGDELDWVFQDGGNDGFPSGAHSGEYNICVSGNGTTKLIMPKMNLEGVGEVDLTFWYAQPAKAHTHDILNVYYKSSECEQWILLKQYSMQVSSWRKRTIELPDLSQNYYIAFEAVCRGGYGIVIDDVNVVTEYDAIDTEDYSEIVKIYPNPASNYLNISSLERIDCVCVYDISGRMVEKTDVNDNKTMIDTFRYDRGIYVVCVEIKEKIYKTKVSITN